LAADDSGEVEVGERPKCFLAQRELGRCLPHHGTIAQKG
jgi:hypothetical protein